MTETITGTRRSAGQSYADILATDSLPVRPILSADSPLEPGPTLVPVERYFSRAFTISKWKGVETRVANGVPRGRHSRRRRLPRLRNRASVVPRRAGRAGLVQGFSQRVSASENFLGSLSDHFTLLPYERRYKSAQILRCNWKVAQEAFSEAYHVVATHPQILGGIGDANTKYDVFGNFSCAISPQAVPSPHLQGMPAFNTPEGMSLCGKLRHPLGGAIYERCADGYVHVTTADRGNWGQGELGSGLDT